MCNCITEIEKEFFERYERGNKQKGRKLKSVDMLGISLAYNPPKLSAITNNAIEVIYEKPKNNGGFKKTTFNAFLRHTFCPFCGVKYIEEKEVNDGSI